MTIPHLQEQVWFTSISKPGTSLIVGDLNLLPHARTGSGALIIFSMKVLFRPIYVLLPKSKEGCLD